ncbi:MAG: hypothetical protein A2Y12_02495 [Planctomycetes bacterium GWF2_42_9]|nr:MAG: hypothetical protein A2Y12_02495 [Planctomycetes bacterium GWF2_42_9]
MLERIGPWDCFTIGIYLLTVIGIGWWFSRKQNTSEDFLLGGRKLPWFVVGISYMMGLLSTYSLVMVPGEIFNHGLSLLLLTVFYPLFSVLAFSIFIRFYFRLQSFTPYEYLERRYDFRIRLLVSGIFFWSRLLYLGMVMFAASKVFEGAAGWPAWKTIVFVGAVTMTYTILGGRKAVIWTDVVQFVILLSGLIFAVYICLKNIDGGFFEVLFYSFKHGRGPTRYAELSFYNVDPYMRLSFWILLIGAITEAMTNASSNQTSVQSLLSTSSYENAKKAIFTNAALSLPFILMMWLIGFAMFTYYAQHPDPRVTSGDVAFYTFIGTRLPTPIPGLLISALLAAAMGALNAGWNSLSAVWLKEFHLKFFNTNLSEKRQVLVCRVAVTLIAIFTMSLALLITVTSRKFNQSVVEAAAIFSALNVVALPSFYFAVFSNRITSKIIWFVTCFCWGVDIGAVRWYTASHSGMSGTMPLSYIGLPVAAFIILFILSIFSRSRWGTISSIVKGASLLSLGFSTTMFIWYICARHGGGELSFQWISFPGVITFLIVGIISIKFFGKTPAPEKYMGLTWSTLNEKVRDGSVGDKDIVQDKIKV